MEAKVAALDKEKNALLTHRDELSEEVERLRAELILKKN